MADKVGLYSVVLTISESLLLRVSARQGHPRRDVSRPNKGPDLNKKEDFTFPGFQAALGPMDVQNHKNPRPPRGGAQRKSRIGNLASTVPRPPHGGAQRTRENPRTKPLCTYMCIRTNVYVHVCTAVTSIIYTTLQSVI